MDFFGNDIQKPTIDMVIELIFKIVKLISLGNNSTKKSALRT